MRSRSALPCLFSIALAFAQPAAAFAENETQPMNSALKLASRTFPSRVADLGFSAQLPVDWTTHALPEESVDVSNPTTFIPLAVVTAPHAVIVFAFSARPAHDDGTLHDWAWYHLKEDGMQPRSIGPAVVAGVAAVTGEAVKPSDFGPMVVRFAFLEDGGRLINLTFAAPEEFGPSVHEAWFAMLRSFRLETPRGSRFQPASAAAEVIGHEPQPEGRTPANEMSETAAPDEMPEPATQPRASMPPVGQVEMTVPAGVTPRKCRLADFALAEDAAALDPESTINSNLRDRGVGLVPQVTTVSEAARHATVAAGAVEALCTVPLGWHVIDDGRRTLVFEPSGKVQINLDVIPRDDRDDDVILDAIESDASDAYPHPHFSRRADGALRTLSVTGIADGDEPLEQHHILRAHGNPAWLLRARVTATPDRSADAWILGTLILENCVFPRACAEAEEASAATASGGADTTTTDTPAATTEGPPAWWTRALELEAQGQLEAAESMIREGCPYIGFAASTAEMYRQRMNRLKAAGDRGGALDAFKRSSEFISFYASMATSGGEGAALSYERDQFRAQLVAEYGCDPEARCA